jgi:hypothetical protein
LPSQPQRHGFGNYSPSRPQPEGNRLLLSVDSNISRQRVLPKTAIRPLSTLLLTLTLAEEAYRAD